jgi:two-component system, NtrC family, response regulator AtoC
MRETSSIVYVVDDDVSMRESVASLLRSAGVAATTFASAQEFLVSCRTELPCCAVLDVRLPGLSGLDLQQELARMNIQVPIIFLTGYADVPTSVRAMKSGALEFLTKPFDDEALLAAVQQGVARSRVSRCKDKAGRHGPELVGCSPRIQDVLKRAAAVATTDASVLIVGETGTGKELVARSIHAQSRRSARPLVSVNCGAIQPSLMASELFGHEKGSFTGALQQRLGRFELADGGTIFLDEIGELPLEAQIALLRVLQEHEFERVGGNKTIRVDVRVIAATNRDLGAAIAAGKFKTDLFFRLNVFPIRVPPLRERSEDIPLLVEHFLGLRARTAGTPLRKVDERTMAMLQRYAWPGNIRELQNVLERWAIICGSDDICMDESWLPRDPTLPESTPRAEPGPQREAQLEPGPRSEDHLESGPPRDDQPLNLREHVEELERTLINRTLADVGGNQSEAARRLGMSRGALLGRLRKYGPVACD